MFCIYRDVTFASSFLSLLLTANASSGWGSGDGNRNEQDWNLDQTSNEPAEIDFFQMQTIQSPNWIHHHEFPFLEEHEMANDEASISGPYLNNEVNLEFNHDWSTVLPEVGSASTSQGDHTNEGGGDKEARKHEKYKNYDADIRELIRCLIQEHHITPNVAYKYIDQGMKKKSITDLDEFKEQCIKKWKRNNAIWGRGSSSRAIWNSKQVNIFESSSAEASQDMSAEVNPEPTTRVVRSEPERDKIAYRIRSIQGGSWRWTQAGKELQDELMQYGMSKDTARRYIIKGVEDKSIYDIEQFKVDCLSKYLNQAILPGLHIAHRRFD